MSKKKTLLAISKKLLYPKFRRDKVIYPSIDKILVQVGSKYLLVNLVSKRVNEMEETGHYQLKEHEYKSKKNIGKALEEVAQDLIHIKD